jgi:hypothetical protein
MYIWPTMSRRVDKSTRRIVVARDGRTADAENQRQQQQHTHVSHVPPNNFSAWIVPFWPSPTACSSFAEVPIGTFYFALKLGTAPENTDLEWVSL